MSDAAMIPIESTVPETELEVEAMATCNVNLEPVTLKNEKTSGNQILLSNSTNCTYDIQGVETEEASNIWESNFSKESILVINSMKQSNAVNHQGTSLKKYSTYSEKIIDDDENCVILSELRDCYRTNCDALQLNEISELKDTTDTELIKKLRISSKNDLELEVLSNNRETVSESTVESKLATALEISSKKGCPELEDLPYISGTFSKVITVKEHILSEEGFSVIAEAINNDERTREKVSSVKSPTEKVTSRKSILCSEDVDEISNSKKFSLDHDRLGFGMTERLKRKASCIFLLDGTVDLDTDQNGHSEVISAETNNISKRSIVDALQKFPSEEVIDVESFTIAEGKKAVTISNGWCSEKPIDVDADSPSVASCMSRKKVFCLDDSDDECAIIGTLIPVVDASRFLLEGQTIMPENSKNVFSTDVDDEDPAAVIDKLLGKLSCPVCMRNFRRPVTSLKHRQLVDTMASSNSKAATFNEDDAVGEIIGTTAPVPATTSSSSLIFLSACPIVSSSSTTSSTALLLPLGKSPYSGSSFEHLSSAVREVSSVSEPPDGSPTAAHLSLVASSWMNLPPCLASDDHRQLSADPFQSSSSFFISRSSATATNSQSTSFRTPFLLGHLSDRNSCERVYHSNSCNDFFKRKKDERQKHDVDDNRTDSLAVTRCGHVFCQICIRETLKMKKQCPLCRKPLKSNQWYPLFL